MSETSTSLCLRQFLSEELANKPSISEGGIQKILQSYAHDPGEHSDEVIWCLIVAMALNLPEFHSITSQGPVKALRYSEEVLAELVKLPAAQTKEFQFV